MMTYKSVKQIHCKSKSKPPGFCHIFIE